MLRSVLRMKGCILTFIICTFFHKNLLVNLHCSTNVRYGQYKNVAVGVDDEENSLAQNCIKLCSCVIPNLEVYKDVEIGYFYV